MVGAVAPEADLAQGAAKVLLAGRADLVGGQLRCGRGAREQRTLPAQRAA